MTTATLESRVAPLPRSYPVDLSPEGRPVIRGVPIFAEHERVFEGGQRVAISLGWLKTCALNMAEDEARDGYAAPIHLGHHDPVSRPYDDRPGVGVIRRPRLMRALFRGRPTWVMVADLEARDREALEQIKRHPYRSVEADVAGTRPRVRGLALMQGQAPYFQFPLLELDESKLDRVAYAAPRAGRLLIGWAEPMRLTEKCMDPEKDEMAADEAKAVEGEVVESVEHEAAEAEGMSRIEAKLDALMGAIEKLAAVFTPAVSEPAPEIQASATRPVMAASATAPAPKAASKPAAKPAPKAVSKPAAKPAGALALAAAYADSVRVATAAKGEEAVVSEAEKALADRPTPDKAKLRAVLVAAYRDGGEPAVAAFVSGLKGLLPSLPGPDAHRDAAPGRSSVPREVAVYADTPVYAKALELWHGWQRRPAAFQSKTLANWLANEPALASYAAGSADEVK